ncbi:hypothetical protein BC827DRAFT_418077 [Russula dissimulans]|nr:hypothetical protein BC827DRAFT_418077 [Russula dissimulans]
MEGAYYTNKGQSECTACACANGRPTVGHHASADNSATRSSTPPRSVTRVTAQGAEAVQPSIITEVSVANSILTSPRAQAPSLTETMTPARKLIRPEELGYDFFCFQSLSNVRINDHLMQFCPVSWIIFDWIAIECNRSNWHTYQGLLVWWRYLIVSFGDTPMVWLRRVLY